jgi:uncharacterized membrane protein
MSSGVRPLFRSFGIALALAISLGQGLAALSTTDGEDPMDDMCSGEMQWMIGWCLDMVMPGDAVEVASLAAPSGAPAYVGEIETINVPNATATRAFGINPQGDIVGSYTAGGVTHGFLLRGGVVTQIDFPNSTSTEAWGINARGDIIGRYTVAGRGGVLGFLLSRGRFTDISIAGSGPGGKHLITLPTKVGASGEVVGCFHDIGSMVDMFGFVQRDSDVTSTFALPSTIGPAAAMHNGITPGGDAVVGLVFNAPGRARGYVIRGGVVTYIDGPGSTNTQAWDISANGTIVGQYDAGGRTHGFYQDDSGFATLDVPNSGMTVARGVNPRGEIVGVYNDAGGAHGFVVRK